MTFAFTPEQEDLRATVRRFLDDRSPESEVRRLMETADGYDANVWAELAELGLVGIAIPEEYGGAGYGFGELAVVFEEMGRSLPCGPYFATVALATHALLLSGDDVARKELLPGIAAGETIATLAVTEDSGRWDADAIATEAVRSGAEWRLSGVKDLVIDGLLANLLLVVARTPAGLSLFAVDGSAAGIDRERLSTVDLTRKLARVTLHDVPARLVGTDGAAWPVVEGTLDRACVALALECVGGAQRCLDMLVDYSKIRMQFGRPIGSFQAVKHRCASMLVAIEGAKSAAYYAANAATTGADDLPLMASVAKEHCTRVFATAAADNIQGHGGIGYTWEHPAHLYLKRAKSAELLLGTAAEHRNRIGTLANL